MFLIFVWFESETFLSFLRRISLVVVVVVVFFSANSVYCFSAVENDKKIIDISAIFRQRKSL